MSLRTLAVNQPQYPLDRYCSANYKLEFGGQMIAQLTVGEATDARAVQAFKMVFFPANSYNLKAFP